MKKTTKKAFNVAIASAMAAGAVVAVAPQSSANTVTSFSDVPATNVHYADITKLVEGNYINGFEDGTYRPSVSVTRGQAAKIIANVLGLDTTNVKDVNFKDLEKTNIFYGPIAALVEAGVINGFEDNTYRPNDTLTRGQMAKIIASAFELETKGETNPFTDADTSIYKDSIIALYANGVTKGKTATSFAPTAPVTRGELASFVVRANDVYANSKTVVENKVTIKEIKDGKVVVAGEELSVDSKLAGFFADKNAAALKDAQLELVVEYTSEKVASLTPVAAVTGTIVGIKSAEFVAENTTFDAAGVEIPLVKTAKGMTLANVVATELVISSDVVLSNVEVASVTITGNAKITIDKDTKIEKVIIPEGKTLADVIANYNEVKEQLADVKVEKAPATTDGAQAGASAGGGGPVSTPSDSSNPPKKDDPKPITFDDNIDNVVDFAVKEINSGLSKLKTTPYLTLSFNKADNTNNITVDIKDGSYTIANVRNDLKTASNGLTLLTLVDDFDTANNDIGAAYKIFKSLKSVTVTAPGSEPTSYDVSDFIKDGFNVVNGDVISGAQTFIDAVTGQTIKNLDDTKTLSEKITITVKATETAGSATSTYTVLVK